MGEDNIWQALSWRSEREDFLSSSLPVPSEYKGPERDYITEVGSNRVEGGGLSVLLTSHIIGRCRIQPKA
jgi:hypothetical protein